MTTPRAATVGGVALPVTAVDERETQLRASPLAGALPAAGTSEGRQLRRWLTQLLVSERVVAREAAGRGLHAERAPSQEELLPDTTATLELGSVASAVLVDPLARALFAQVTMSVTVSAAEVASYHERNPGRFARPEPASGGWWAPAAEPPLEQVRAAIEAELLGAARRRAFRVWLESRLAELVELAPGYEHPGDPRQPDNTHRH